MSYHWIKAIFWILCLFLGRSPAFGQWEADLNRVNAHMESIPEIKDYAHPAKFKWHWNPLRMALHLPLLFYQKELTYQIHASCVYTPSCSEFSRQAFVQYGPVKGLLLTLDRLSRCNQLSAPKKEIQLFAPERLPDPPDHRPYRKGL